MSNFINNRKKRIEYIDLMKGICISIVVLYHCDALFYGAYQSYNNYLQIFRMPLYFFLSGLFFKYSDGFLILMSKKINNLVIPYFFFSSFILIVHYCVPTFNVEMANWKYYLFCYLEPYNLPLWFLRSLFIVYVLYYIICIFFKKIEYKILVSFLFSVMIWYFAPILKNHMNIYTEWILFRMNLLSSIFVLPFMSVAELCRTKGILSITLSRNVRIIMTAFCVTLLVISTPEGFNLYATKYPDNLLLFYISSFSGIFAILFFSSIFKKVPFFSYIGRYSLIVLGTHSILIIIFRYLFPGITPWSLGVFVLGSSPFFIYILKKYFPYFTAQMPLFEYKEHKLKFFWDK